MTFGERVLKFYGSNHQINKTIEELSELIRALSRYQNAQTEENKFQVEEEIADCEIMIDQMRQVFDSTAIYYFKVKKQKRLDGLMLDK